MARFPKNQNLILKVTFWFVWMTRKSFVSHIHTLKEKRSTNKNLAGIKESCQVIYLTNRFQTATQTLKYGRRYGQCYLLVRGLSKD